MKALSQDKRIKVLHITSVSEIGGTETMLLRFLTYADFNIFNYCVASLFAKGPLKKCVSLLGVKFYDLNIKQFWMFPLRLFQIIRYEQVDIVQVYGRTADFFVRPFAKLFGAKIFISSIRSANEKMKWYNSIVASFAISQVDFWIANSYAGKKSAIQNKEALNNKIKVIPNGLDLNKFRKIENSEMHLLRKNYSIDLDCLVVLTIANLRGVKRHEDIIQTIPILIKQGITKIKFFFVGKDKSNGYCQQLAKKLGVFKYIIFTGFQEDLKVFHSIADIFLLPSEWEGMPVSVMEAMGYELPIVATKVGGVPELIIDKNEGFLIPVKSPTAIANAILDLYYDVGKRKIMGLNARKKIEKNFSIELMVDRLQSTYYDALNKNRFTNIQKPIKVLQIIGRLNIGGPAIHVIRLSSELNDENFKTSLVIGTVSKNEGDMSYLAKKIGVKPIVIQEMERNISLKDDFITIKKLYELIKSLKPQIIHTHTAKAGTIGRIAAIITRIPFRFHTFHGHVFEGYFSSRKTKFYIFIERILARFTQRIIVISPDQRYDLSKKYRIAPVNKFVTIPLGFDLEPFLSVADNQKDSKEKLGLNTDVLVVSIVGRLVPIKNHDLFLKSASNLILEHGKHLQFLIVGDGELRKNLEEKVDDLKIRQYVHFVGWQSDMTRIYQASDIVVLTSINEGTPVSLIEAMAAGKPVVSTNVGGVKFVVEHGKTGYIVPANDERELTEKILLLINNKQLRKQFGKNAQRIATKKFAFDRFYKDITNLFLKYVTQINN